MLEAVLELPEQHATVLSFLAGRVPLAEKLWALTGSAGLRLQGVDVSVRDLDLQTDADTVFLLERELAGFVTVPVHPWQTGHTRSYHGQAVIQGVQVDLLGDIRHRLPDQSWDAPVDIRSVLHWVKWRNLKIPVLSLADEAFAYEKMGRIKKAGLIRAALWKES